MASKMFLEYRDRDAPLEARQQSRRANRRRLFVFAAVFLVVAIIGLVYDFSRPAIYQATARLNFVPGTGQPADDPTKASEKPYSLRDEVQYLTSTTLLGKVWDTLKQSSTTPAVLQSGDPPATLQSMLAVKQIGETNIVAVQATGAEPAFLPVFIDRLVADYRASLAARYRSGSTTAVAEAEDEARKLDAAVDAKRAEVDAFRARNNIVSLERDENQVLSEVKGVGASLNTANEKVVQAEAKLGALTEAEASGRSVTRAKDNPTLAALEQQAAGIRGDLQETARTFTPEYMKIDPRIRSLRARLADLEQQMVTQRQSSQQGAIQEAREDLASAKAAVAALRRQLATNQDSVQTFTSRFNELKAKQDQLTNLQKLQQKATDRLTTLQAEQQSRLPKVEVLEAASTPQSPSSPQYARDAAIALAAAVVAGLLTMAIVELFNRPPQGPSTIVVPQTSWGGAMGMAPQAVALPAQPAYDALGATPEAPPTPRLQGPQNLPRELTTVELDALLAAADAKTRPAIGLLLIGLTPHEVVSLHRGDVQREVPHGNGSLIVTGTDERSVALPQKVLDWLPDHDEPTDAALLGTPSGRPLAESELNTALLYAAHDAAIDDADEITPEALRHTYIAYLVRQGLRFSDLARIVGALPSDRLAAYRQLTLPGSHASPDEVDLVLPSMRESAA